MNSECCPSHAGIMMEILDWFLPIQTQYLEAGLRFSRTGNTVEIHFHLISCSFPLYFHFRSFPLRQVEINRKYVSSLFPIPRNGNPNEDSIMPGKPYQSVLIPHEEEISALRRRRPPTPYTRIAELLKEKYDLSVQAPAIFKFIRTRSKGRKVFSYARNVKTTETRNAASPVTVPSRQTRKPSLQKPSVPARPESRFEYQYSTTYNLHRLSPEEAAARLKKLEEKER